MTYQLESIWLEYTPQYEKETKRLKNHIVETTLINKSPEKVFQWESVYALWLKSENQIMFGRVVQTGHGKQV